MVTFTRTTAGSVSRVVDNLTVSNETTIGTLGTGEQGLNLAHTHTDVPNTGSSDGSVTVTYAGTMAANTPRTLTSWSTLSAGNQRIFRSGMTLPAKGC